MRLMLKTTTYGILHIAVATLVAYALTGNWAIALGIGLIEPIVQTFVFTLHEWAWEHKKGEPLKMKAHQHQIKLDLETGSKNS